MVTDPVAFTVGPLAVRWYGILIMLGVLAGAALAARLARRQGEDPEQLWNMVPLVVFAAIAGARAYWVWLDWDRCCAADPWQALNIRGGGISIHGALGAGVLALWLFARFNRLRFWRWVDIIAPGLALGQAIGRWGNFANQEAFGGPTGLPWGIYISPGRRPAGYGQFDHFHPTFLYESLYNLVACVVLYQVAVRSGRGGRLREGDTLWLYLIGYAVARFAIESLRTDSLDLGPFKAAHVLSAVLLLVGLVGLGWRHLGWRGAAPPPPATPGVAPVQADALSVEAREVGDVPAHSGGLQRLGGGDAGAARGTGPRT